MNFTTYSKTYFHLLLAPPMQSIFLILFVLSGVESMQPICQPSNALVNLFLKIENFSLEMFSQELF